MNVRCVLIPTCVALAVAALVAWAASVGPPAGAAPATDDAHAGLTATIGRLDDRLESRWQAAGVLPAEPADELQVLRRLALVLHGTIPSLEEIRRFEADRGPDRLARWTAAMLSDARFADYFAERLARGVVGTEGGQFLVYRRDRLVDWLAGQLADNRPYDQLVRDLLASEGLWTGAPATNFVTAAIMDGDVAEHHLAGRTVRAFLGQRIDCAQCHDHPFADWKQRDFEGLAAFFGQTRVSLAGVEDTATSRAGPVEYVLEDAETQQARVVPPDVPFDPQWLPATGTRRQRLALWVTHPQNRRFHRATVNRVWALLFGRAHTWPEHAVDDVPDPQERRTEFHSVRPPAGRSGTPSDSSQAGDVLDVLADDFREHGCDLRRLIRAITGSRAFRLSSRHTAVSEADFERAERAWAVYPVTRLRPEQLVGSMLQAASIGTIDQNSHLLVRIHRFFGEQDFVEEYGDLGENELEEQSGTIPQALLRMNGELSRNLSRVEFVNAAGRIEAVARDPERCVETIYLVCLTRRPTAEELAAFAPQLRSVQDDERDTAVEDLFWALFNIEEFAWNH